MVRLAVRDRDIRQVPLGRQVEPPGVPVLDDRTRAGDLEVAQGDVGEVPLAVELHAAAGIAVFDADAGRNLAVEDHVGADAAGEDHARVGSRDGCLRVEGAAPAGRGRGGGIGGAHALDGDRAAGGAAGADQQGRAIVATGDPEGVAGADLSGPSAPLDVGKTIPCIRPVGAGVRTAGMAGADVEVLRLQGRAQQETAGQGADEKGGDVHGGARNSGRCRSGRP